jgi:hypothetical protein
MSCGRAALNLPRGIWLDLRGSIQDVDWTDKPKKAE